MVGFEWLDFTPTERISRSERTLDEARFWPMVLHLNLTSYGWLLRGRAAAKSLSGCGRLYHRRGIYYSNRFRRFSRVAIAELDASSCGRAFADWVSDCAHPCLGLRRYAARNSGHANAPRSASAPQSYPPRRSRGDNFHRRGIFPVATRIGAQDRQIGRGIAVGKSER